MGLYIEHEGKECMVYDNLFYKNSVGVRMVNAPNAVLWGNRFIENDVQASASGTSYSWYAKYPKGGNYWSDYSGTKDVKKGTQQDETGSDGFGDEPYVSGNARDIYPIFTDEITPIARAGTDVTMNLGDIFPFDATMSEDDQMVTNFNWTFEYDGEVICRDLSKFNFKFDIAGTYDCILNVSDFAGNWDTDELVITVVDQTIPIVITQGNITQDQDTVVNFNATGSYDNGIIVNYTWVFEYDGETVQIYGPEPSFPFDIPGLYEIDITVTDSEGNYALGSFFVDIIDTEYPIAKAGEDEEIENGDTLEIDAVLSTDNGIIVSCNWTFEYGGNMVSLHGMTESYIFNIPGYYRIELTVTDAYGNTGYDVLNLTVIDTIDPVSVITGSLMVLEGEQLSLDGSDSTDNGRIKRYVWTFNDTEEKTIEGAELTYEFQKKGFHDITLTVYDEWNNSASKTVTVEIVDFTLPTADAGEDITVPAGTTVTFDGSGSSDDGSIVKWEWSFNYDDEEQEILGENAEFTFEKGGEYTILLTVYDQSDNIGDDQILVTVVDTGTFSGVVLDNDGNPVSRAKIVVVDSNGNSFQTSSGDDGSFSLEATMGSVTWTISKIGYKEISGTAEILPLETTTLDLSDKALEKEDESSSMMIFIIIISIASVVLIVIAIILFLVLKRKGSKEEETDESAEEEKDDDDLESLLSGETLPADDQGQIPMEDAPAEENSMEQTAEQEHAKKQTAEEYFSDQQPPSEIESKNDLVGDLFPEEEGQNQESQ